MAVVEEHAELIAELPQWNNGDGIDVESWVCCMGNYDLAVGYSFLFWPEFVVIDDYVLRPGVTEDAVRLWEKSTPSPSAIEAVLNHVHVADIHVNASPPNEAQLRHLGRVMAAMLELKLKRDFPDRRFVVSFNDEPGLDPVDYQFTFYQERSGK